ncbi:MAG: hypothetical protein GHCLOJNM_02899 [bacterium]|nr:hypothetical protein [bacterium]
MKRILLRLLALVLGILVVVAALIWYRRPYLDPKQLLDTVRGRIEESIGRSVEFKEAELAGLEGIEITGLRIPSAAWDGGLLLLEAERASARWKWLGALMGGLTRIECEIDKPRVRLAYHPERGWNWEAEQPTRERSESMEDTSPPRGTNRARGRMRIGIQAKDLDLELAHPDWNAWRVAAPRTSTVELVRSGDHMGSWALTTEAEVRSGSLPATFPSLSPFNNNLLATFSPAAARLSLNAEGHWTAETYELQSRGEKGLEYQGPGFNLSVDRFRFALRRGPGEPTRLESAALDVARVELANWASPLVAQMRMPWTEPPSGPMRFEVRNLQVIEDRLSLTVDGVRIESVTFAARDLPWLRILTRRELWGLRDVTLKTTLDFRDRGRRCDWSGGQISLDGGKGGTVITQGFFRGGEGSEWQARTQVSRYPVPSQEVEGQVFEPGVLSGEMTWGEVRTRDGGITLSGKGKIVLEGGEIGAVRMLGRIDEILDVEAIARSRFETLSFHFDHDGTRLKIDNLNLRSKLLELEGGGVYGGGGEIEIDLVGRPSQELAATMKKRSAAVLVGAISSSGRIAVKIRGNLDHPEYEFIPGEGVEIPIQDILEEITGKPKGQ